MLLRPPFIQQDDVKSQTSNPMSHMQKQKSVKSTSKNKKKQNTIGMKKSNMMMGMPYSNLSKEIESHNNNGYDSDNGSVHSVNSRKSKGRAKQSTIAIGKKQPQLINTNQNSAYSIKNTNQKQQYEIFKLDDEDDDNRSVGSHASRNSRKNAKKENSLGGVKNKANQKVNVQLNYYYNNNDKNNNNNDSNSNNTQRDYYMEQQSKVQIVKLNENTDTFTQPLKYNQALQKNNPVLLGKNPESKRRTQHVVTNKQPLMSASPFQEITLKRQQEYDDQPVYRLKQPEDNYNRKYGGNNNLLNNKQQQQKQQQNPFSQRVTNNNNSAFVQQNAMNKPSTLLGYQNYENQKPTQQQKQPTLQQSTAAIQPQMISTKSVTKSRRNKIFDNDNNSISNSSNIMNSRSNNNMEGSFQRSRSKSKSKLGELLKQNREKQKRQGQMSRAIQRQPYSDNVIKPVELGYRQQQNRQLKQQQRVRYENNNQNYGYNNNNINNNNFNYNNNKTQITNKNYQPIQKQQQQSSNTSNFNYNNNPSISINQNTSRLGGNKLQQNHLKPQPIKRKSIQNQQFDLGQSNLQLNLSMSHKVPQQPQSITSATTTGLMKGDSVLFNFQPQRKKGISITSKDNKPSSTSSISRAENKSIQSKKHLDRLMRKCQQNQQFLAKSILSNSSELRESSKRIGVVSNNNNNNMSSNMNVNVVNSPNLNPNLIKREETLTRPFEKIKQNPIKRQRIQQPQQHQVQQQQPAWHQMVKNDAAFQIKSVQRKEIRRPSQQVIRVNHQPQAQLQFQQTKPMSPAEFFRLQNQQQQQLYQQHPQKRPQKNFIPQQQDVRIHQQQQKNRILAQINKKSKFQQQVQKQITHQKDNFSQLQNKNKMKSPEPFYQNQYQGDQQEINLNYSDAQDVRDKQKSTKNNNQNSNKQSLKDHVQASSLSHQLSLSENGSQRSNSQSAKKQRKKQSSLNIMKKHKVQVREQQPRAQQSFYQQPPQQKQQIPLQQNIKYKQQVKMTKIQSEDNTDRTFKLQQSKTKIDYKKPNLINFQENEIEQEKIKSKTDMNFYNYGDRSQRSIRVPSSKPPLSRKSNCSSSKSKSKAKQSTLNINPVKKETKIKQVSSNQNNNLSQQQQQPKKKKTLLQIAQDKQYEGSGYGGSDSQCSFNSRQSFGSVNSKNSRRSSSSKKQSTLPITIKNNNKSTTMNQFRPSLNKLPSSTNSQVEIFSNNIIDNQSIYNSLKQQSVRRESRERERTQQSFNQQYPRHEQRTIVSKDTYYIDQRGRLVKQDLIIKGNQIYTQPSSNRSAQQMAMERMRRSREHHRSRSKSRDGSRSRLSKKTSQSSMEESGCESMASSQSNYYNNNKGSTNYGSSQYGMVNQQRQGNLYIEQFIKPIQQQPSNRGRQLSNQQSNQQYRFQKPSSNNNQRRTQIQHQFYQSSQYNHQPQQQYYESQYSYQQNDQYEEYDQEEPQVQRVTLNQLFGRNTKNNNTKQSNNNNNNSSSNYYNQQQRSGQNSTHYQQNYNNTGSTRRQQYGGTTNSRYNPQQSALGQSNSRKKSLSRTQKTFYHK